MESVRPFAALQGVEVRLGRALRERRRRLRRCAAAARRLAAVGGRSGFAQAMKKSEGRFRAALPRPLKGGKRAAGGDGPLPGGSREASAKLRKGTLWEWQKGGSAPQG